MKLKISATKYSCFTPAICTWSRKLVQAFRPFSDPYQRMSVLCFQIKWHRSHLNVVFLCALIGPNLILWNLITIKWCLIMEQVKSRDAFYLIVIFQKSFSGDCMFGTRNGLLSHT